MSTSFHRKSGGGWIVCAVRLGSRLKLTSWSRERSAIMVNFTFALSGVRRSERFSQHCSLNTFSNSVWRRLCRQPWQRFDVRGSVGLVFCFFFSWRSDGENGSAMRHFFQQLNGGVRVRFPKRRILGKEHQQRQHTNALHHLCHHHHHRQRQQRHVLLLSSY